MRSGARAAPAHRIRRLRGGNPAAPGSDYSYVVDGIHLPDPCSRWQPHGLRGSSRVLDAGAFGWTDSGFATPALHDLVLYGGPLGLQRLVDPAHAEGLAVTLDVVHRVHAANPRAPVIAESGLNDPKVVQPDGWGCDAAWADAFHHALHVALTGEIDGLYEEFASIGTLVKAFGRPHVHDGTYASFRGRRFGAPADDVEPERFVVFSSNHDQLGNRAFGDRPAATTRPLAALLTSLAPFTPMLFQGEEYGERAPFRFFSDHIDSEIATATRQGRRHEFASFESYGQQVPDPQDPRTFERSELKREGEPAGMRELYAAALALRSELAGEEAHAEVEGRALTVRRGPYRILATFAGEPMPLDGEPVLTAGEVRDGALAPLAGAVAR